MKLSFKKEKRESGLSSVGYPYPNTNIKVDGKVIGYISGPNWKSTDSSWNVYIATIKSSIDEDGNPNCPWKWTRLLRKFDTEAYARIYLRNNKEDIFKLDLHYFDS